MTQVQTLQNLQRKVLSKIKELQTISQRKWGVSPEMKISYNLDSVTTLGTADWYKKTMRLNKYLLLEFDDLYIDEIIVHEYCHFVVSAMVEDGAFHSKPRPHGREFKQVCSHFGIEGKATTDKFSNSKHLKSKSDKLKAKKKVFYYSCDCPNKFHELTVQRHNKIRRGWASYSCKNCGQTLTFKKQKGIIG